MAQMTSWVHRYTLRELMDDSFDLFKERAVKLLLAGLIPGALVVIYNVLMLTFYIPGNFLLIDNMDGLNELMQTTQFWMYILGLFFVCSLSGFIGLIAQCRIAMQQVLGERHSLPKAFRLLAKPYFSMFVVGFIYSIALCVATMVCMMVVSFIVAIISIIAISASMVESVLGTILLVIGMSIWVLGIISILLIVSTLFLTTPVVLAHEHAGPFKALSRSFGIAATNFKTQLGGLYAVTHLPVTALSVFVLAGALLYLLVQTNLPESAYEIISSLLMMIFGIAFSGVLACMMALTYIDGRCRIDATDLQMLATEIGLGEQFNRAYQKAGTATPLVQYPDYSVPVTGASPSSPTASITTAFPDYSAPPPAAGDSAPPAAADFPDYSALPVEEPAADPPVAVAVAGDTPAPAGAAEPAGEEEGQHVP